MMTHTDRIPWTRSDEVFRDYWAEDLNRDNSVLAFVPDILATMMAMQRRHMAVYCDPDNQKPDSLQLTFPLELTGQWHRREVHESFRRTMMWAVEELVEAVGMFKGKPWKKNFEAPDRDKVLDEIGDAMHFFLEACLVLGLTPEDLFLAYFGAAFKNVSRQNGEY